MIDAPLAAAGPDPERVGATRAQQAPARHRSSSLAAAWLSRRWRTVPQPVWDVTLTAVLALFSVLTTYGRAAIPGAPDRGGWPLTLLAAIAAASALPVLGRRRWPIGMLLVHGGYVAACDLSGRPMVITPATTLLLLYAAAVRGHVLVPSVVGVPANLVLQTWPGEPLRWDGVPDAVLTTAVAVGTGVLVRQRRAQVAAADDRAERAERERDLRAAAAVSAERTRIARELHDVVAHNLGFVVLEATAGRHASATDPQLARESLERIEHTGREGLREMRLLLGLLRDTADRAGMEEPQPGLTQLTDLANRTRHTGLAVDLRVTGDTPVPAAVDLSAYRIVQEALTNVAKHAGAARVTIEVDRRADGVNVRVADDGRGPSAVRGDRVGHGLIGMRERAALFGGHVRAGAHPGGGFVVEAWLPTPPEGRS